MSSGLSGGSPQLNARRLDSLPPRVNSLSEANGVAGWRAIVQCPESSETSWQLPEQEKAVISRTVAVNAVRRPETMVGWILHPAAPLWRPHTRWAEYPELSAVRLFEEVRAATGR